MSKITSSSHEKGSVKNIAKALKTGHRACPLEALKQASLKKSEITPELIEILNETLQNYQSMDEAFLGHVYALFLLAEFKEKTAFPLLIEMLSLPEEWPDRLLGDWLIEDGACLLASLYDGNPKPLYNLVQSPRIYEFSRSVALEALFILHAFQMIESAELKKHIHEWIERSLAEKDTWLLTELACEVGDSGFKEFADPILEGFRKKIIDTSIISLQDFEKDLRYSHSSKRDHFRLVENALDEMKKFFDSSSNSTKSATSKFGRNDLCPCGSGKKYKKCCAA